MNLNYSLVASMAIILWIFIEEDQGDSPRSFNEGSVYGFKNLSLQLLYMLEEQNSANSCLEDIKVYLILFFNNTTTVLKMSMFLQSMTLFSRIWVTVANQLSIFSFLSYPKEVSYTFPLFRHSWAEKKEVNGSVGLFHIWP